MNEAPINRVSTLFLKMVLLLMGAIALAFCVFSFPHVWGGAPREWPEITHVLYPGLIGIYATIIPFVCALYQAFNLLRLIDADDAFSERSIGALRIIAYCAIAMSLLYAIALPLIFTVAELDDAPGLILMGLAFAAAPLTVATFAAVLRTLVRSAIDLKTENDLTI